MYKLSYYSIIFYKYSILVLFYLFKFIQVLMIIIDIKIENKMRCFGDMINNSTDFIENKKISKKQWKDLISNHNIFKDNDKKLIKKINKSGGKATIRELVEFDESFSSSYNFPVVSLSKRIRKYLEQNGENFKENNINKSWWTVLFRKNIREKNHYYWIFHEELIEAINELENQNEL